jgi:hypothetical protein
MADEVAATTTIGEEAELSAVVALSLRRSRPFRWSRWPTTATKKARLEFTME